MPVVVQPDGWKMPRGYANGMLASGRILAVSGQVGWDAEGHLVSKDFVRQFVQALDNVLAIVSKAGGRAEDVVSMTVYVTDKLKYVASTQELGVAWRERMGRHYPAMTLLEVKDLLETGAVVELAALAVIPEVAR